MTIQPSQTEQGKGVYEYVGNCLDSFDEDGNSLIDCFCDFAQMEENAKEIPEEEFFSKLSRTQYQPFMFGTETIFLLSECQNVLMAYLPQTDVHYFFVKKIA